MDVAPEKRERFASPDEESELLRPKYWSEEIDLAPPNLCWAASEELREREREREREIHTSYH